MDSEDVTSNLLAMYSVGVSSWLTKVNGYLFLLRSGALFFPSESRVLDLGCANGWMTKILSGYYRNIVGIDDNRRMIDAGIKNGVNVRLMDAHELLFKNDSFDLVVISNCLHHVEDWRKVLGEAVRCVVPRGTIIIREPCENIWTACVERLSKLPELLRLPHISSPIVECDLEDKFFGDWPMHGRKCLNDLGVEIVGGFGQWVHRIIVSRKRPC